MRDTTKHIGAVLLLAAGFVGGACMRGGSATAAPVAGGKAWEYRLVSTLDINKNDTEANLNKIGAEGWEFAGFYEAPEYLRPAALFKRPK